MSNKVGRPTKMTPELIEVLKEVVENALYCTDEDLLFLLNEKLEPENQIALQTFKEYKGGTSQPNNPLMDKFSYLIKKALINEKQELLKELKKGENQWQSKAWILERKFTEWNLQKISKAELKINTDEVPQIKWTD